MGKLNKYLICAALTAAIASCSSNPGWELSGRISDTDADSTALPLLLEGQNKLGGWYIIDTLDVNSDGRFTVSGEKPAYPEIYRLTYGPKSVYFPVDSVESLEFATSARNFDRNYTLTGSQAAIAMATADSLINTFIATNSVAALDTANAFKRRLADIVLADPAGIVAYYIVNKTINGTPLLNTSDKRYLRIIGAVANAFSERRPSDPRCRMMSDRYLTNIKHNTTARDTILAEEIGMIDIELPNATGTKVKLSDIADKNKVVVLNFTSYTQDFSAPLNIELRKIYDRYHSQGLEIYQVGLDQAAQSDNFEWRQSARNLPWTTVYNGTLSEYVTSYNVPTVPAIFVISGGTIVSRPANVEQLNSTLSKLMGQ